MNFDKNNEQTNVQKIWKKNLKKYEKTFQKSEPKQKTNEVNLLIKYQPLNKTKRIQENNGSN